ncbi:MAG: redox-regulated ATPase YchF [Candidatus Mcinerneyibacterium aminivorans]|uniref:Ribosome-binding ATPase YchF n=1 Tax=Candidatus Mcinerneyibacterium aminivorans TaxID=2703815 RepID=A0A5D0MGC1_9BACT|nr:MAG: redox-regulated ATPase YchF [Candidatus Mcinerneyibacterium aminivorans]
MALNCGIIGLPNVGKSTIFSALTSAPAEAANYPFCTIEANVGIVDVPDKRLQKIADIFNPKEVKPTSIEFVDIAGLVEGASKGEGLGNKFLANIREVSALIHVVRCFENDDITHVYETIDPVRDIEIINMELSFADLETVEKRLKSIDKSLISHDKTVRENAKFEKDVLLKIEQYLSNGKPARLAKLNELEKKSIKSLNLLTLKQVLYVCNVAEDDIKSENKYVKEVEKVAAKEEAHTISLSGEIESQIAELEENEEKKEFMTMLGIETPGLYKLINKAYKLLGLRTFFTAGKREVSAWTFKHGMKAPETAGVIHSDFEKGFIRAEVYHYEDLIEHKEEKKLKENGKLRLEGKDYKVQDGDIMFYRFNV